MQTAKQCWQGSQVHACKRERKRRALPAFQRVIANSREGEGILHIRKNTVMVLVLKVNAAQEKALGCIVCLALL